MRAVALTRVRDAGAPVLACKNRTVKRIRRDGLVSSPASRSSGPRDGLSSTRRMGNAQRHSQRPVWSMATPDGNRHRGVSSQQPGQHLRYDSPMGSRRGKSGFGARRHWKLGVNSFSGAVSGMAGVSAPAVLGRSSITGLNHGADGGGDRKLHGNLFGGGEYIRTRCEPVCGRGLMSALAFRPESRGRLTLRRNDGRFAVQVIDIGIVSSGAQAYG